MSLSISIRFLSGRAHLHPWQTHHSEGKVEWPPSQWRLLRALVAVAGRGLTSLPDPDFFCHPGKKPSFGKKNPAPAWPDSGYQALPDNWFGAEEPDDLPISRLSALLSELASVPEIWLPRTSGGHTRQFFAIHKEGMVKNSGSAVFDTFAVVQKDQPLVFHWPACELSEESFNDLKTLLQRMTYFGRAESWAQAQADREVPTKLPNLTLGKTHWRCVCIEDGATPEGDEYADYTLERRLAPLSMGELANEARRIFGDLRKPTKLEAGKEIDDSQPFEEIAVSWPERITLAKGRKKLCKLIVSGIWNPDEIKSVAAKIVDDDARKVVAQLITKCQKRQVDWEDWKRCFAKTSDEGMLLRSLLRESGNDMKDGLERPIGTRWVHYAVPRAIFDIPRRPIRRERPAQPRIQVVRFVLNTATIHRPVLPPITDTLLVADKFRSALLAIHNSLFRDRIYPRNLLGREENGDVCKGHDHAYFWPTDEDNDGFLDHVSVYCPAGFGSDEINALQRLTRLKQRGGRPDLLVSPLFQGLADDCPVWNPSDATGSRRQSDLFVSATPYFCPLHLSHGRSSSGKLRSISKVILNGLVRQAIINDDSEIHSIDELVFDYSPNNLKEVQTAIAENIASEPVPPRQYFPPGEPRSNYPPLPKSSVLHDPRYPGAFVKDAVDGGFTFGSSVGLYVCEGTRFIRSMAFARRRRHHQVKGHGRMFAIRFKQQQTPYPFAIGSQCHYGLGLFMPVFS